MECPTQQAPHSGAQPQCLYAAKQWSEDPRWLDKQAKISNRREEEYNHGRKQQATQATATTAAERNEPLLFCAEKKSDKSKSAREKVDHVIYREHYASTPPFKSLFLFSRVKPNMTLIPFFFFHSSSLHSRLHPLLHRFLIAHATMVHFTGSDITLFVIGFFLPPLVNPLRRTSCQHIYSLVRYG